MDGDSPNYDCLWLPDSRIAARRLAELVVSGYTDYVPSKVAHRVTVDSVAAAVAAPLDAMVAVAAATAPAGPADDAAGAIRFAGSYLAVPLGKVHVCWIPEARPFAAGFAAIAPSIAVVVSGGIAA